MNIFMAIKEKLINALTKYLTVNEPIYMEKGSSLMCKDKVGNINMSTSIVANHIDPDLDIPVEFPGFSIIKKTSKEGQYSMHLKHILNIDADTEPTEGSLNLLTSGTIYEVIKDLVERIDTLEKQLNK